MFIFKRTMLTILVLLGILSVLGAWYRYMVIEDYTYTSKPIETFTEDDL